MAHSLTVGGGSPWLSHTPTIRGSGPQGVMHKCNLGRVPCHAQVKRKATVRSRLHLFCRLHSAPLIRIS